MSTAERPRTDRYRTTRRPPTPADSLASVYVDKAAASDAVRAAAAELPVPPGVTKVRVDDHSVSDTFGCRIAIDLTGSFDPAAEGVIIARGYARRLAAVLGYPAFALYDLLRAEPTQFLY